MAIPGARIIQLGCWLLREASRLQRCAAIGANPDATGLVCTTIPALHFLSSEAVWLAFPPHDQTAFRRSCLSDSVEKDRAPPLSVPYGIAEIGGQFDGRHEQAAKCGRRQCRKQHARFPQEKRLPFAGSRFEDICTTGLLRPMFASEVQFVHNFPLRAFPCPVLALAD